MFSLPRSTRSLVLAFSAAVFLTASAGLAQVRSGRISGAVQDTTGAKIADAQVEVLETSTGQRYPVTTNDEGEFQVPYLPGGTYEVKVVKEGFVSSAQSGIALGVSETVRIEVVLRVGGVQTVVNVTDTGGTIQTESSSISGVTTTQLIQALPNVNHNPLYFATLQLGATPRASMTQVTGQNSFGIGINGRRNVSAIAINGGGAFQNDVQVDGVGVVGSAWNEAAVLPNSEGLQEVRTTVNNYSAEYGRGQGVVLMTTKSGTNEFHGSALWRHRNDFFNANSFSNNARGIDKPGFKVHTYGGSFGGPAIRDKAFFFASWEGLKFNEGLIFLRTVPTELERRGDFSRTLSNVNGVPTPIQLFDPFTVTPGGTNVFQRDAIPNSVIPANRLNPAALRLASQYPLPNRTPDDVYNTNNFQRSATRVYGRNNLNSRFDYRAGEKHSLYATGGFTFGDITNPLTFSDDNLNNSIAGEGFSRFIRDRNPYFSVGDTFVVSPTFIVDVRYGLNRIRTGALADDTPDYDYRAAGIPANIEAAMAVRRLPNFFIAGTSWSNLNNNAYNHKDERQTNHVVAGSATKSAGKWTFKFGGEYRANHSNYTDAQEAISYRLNSSFTAGSNVNATGGTVGAIPGNQGGHAWASFLLGAGNLEIGRGFNAKPAFLQKYMALYSQNDWRPTNRLTINLGLRWDAQPGVTDRYNQISSFDAAAKNPYGSQGAFYFPGSTGEDRSLWETDWINFGPRVGLAFRLRENLVLRGGYGITYLPSNTGFFDGPYNYGMQSFAPYTDAQPYGVTPAGVVVGDFAQVTRLITPTGADPNAPALYGSPGPRFPRTGYITPLVNQANAFIDWRKGAWNFAVGWSGSYGRSLALSSSYTANNDQFIPAATLASWRENYISRNGTGHTGNDLVPNPFQPANGPRIPFLGSIGNANIALRETLLPFPLFGGMQVQRQGGFSDYNAFQTSVSRTFSNGFLFTAHYTWSRALEVANAEAQNNFGGEGFGSQSGNFLDLRQNRRLSSNDVPHRIVMTYLYELPFGKGRQFGANNAWVSAIAGGWQVSGVWMYQMGTPILVSGANNGSLNGRPNVVPGVDLEVPAELQRWYDGNTNVTLPSGRTIRPCNFCFLKYNPDAFQGQTVRVANGTLQRDIYWWGNAAFTYNELRNDALNNWTMSVQRTFSLTERFRFDVQAHAHNLFNHTQFSPGYNLGLGATEILNNPGVGQVPGLGQNANYGTHGLATYDSRNIEFVLKLRF